MTICTFEHIYKVMTDGYQAEQTCVVLGKDGSPMWLHFSGLQYHEVGLGSLRPLPALTNKDFKNGPQGRTKAMPIAN